MGSFKSTGRRRPTKAERDEDTKERLFGFANMLRERSVPLTVKNVKILCDIRDRINGILGE